MGGDRNERVRQNREGSKKVKPAEDGSGAREVIVEGKRGVGEQRYEVGGKDDVCVKC